jgi:hypothetical protein
MRNPLAILLLLLPLILAAADTATVRIVPRELTPGQPFQMEIAITSTDDFPGPALRISRELPAIEDIPLRFSTQRIESGNVTTLVVNGVAPQAPGDYTIPGFTATLAVRKVSIPATRLTVKPAPPGATTGFARFSLEMPERVFYVGETVPARIILRNGTDERVMGFYGVEASGEGLSCRNQGQVPRAADADAPFASELDVTPTQAGQLELRVGGVALVEGARNDPGSSRQRPFQFTRKLRVRHVPEQGQPADWTGAVGTLEAGAITLSNPEPGIGEPTVLSLTLKGKGNLDRLLAPEVPHGDAWDVQPAVAPRSGRSSGQRTFAYTLIPRLPGTLRTPAVRVSFFNPDTAKFERIEFPSLEVKVTGQAPTQVELVAIDPAAPAATAASAAARVTELADPQVDMGHASAEMPLLARPGTLVWTQLGALLVLAAGLGWAARRDWLARHPELVRRRKALSALRAARRRLRRAERAGAGDLHAAAAVEALRAGSAVRVAASDVALTADDVLRVAPELHKPEAVRAVFRRADGTRFGGQPAPDTLSLHADVERCIAQLEAHLCD